MPCNVLVCQIGTDSKSLSFLGGSFMTEFVNMWKNYVNFSARTTRRGYWMAYLFLVILSIIVQVIANITGADIISTIFGLAVLIPALAMGIRRLRDAGKGLWWIIIPIGNIIMLAQPSKPDDGVPVV